MNISNFLIKVTDYLKPVLIKIIPMNILSKAKKRFMGRNTSSLATVEIEKFQKENFPIGINLIGNIKADSGLGQSNRLLAYALEKSKYETAFIEHTVSNTISRTNTTYDDKLVSEPKYGINIFHINAHEFTLAYMQLGKKIWDGHYNIAYWLWELEEFPDEWIDCINILDEIWTPAEFVSESIRKKTDKPVITIPYHVTAQIDQKYDRDFFGLPKDKFLFLMMFDSGSIIERKNPLAVMEAFKMAFGREETDVGLVIKLNSGTEKDLSLINSVLDGYNNIYIINETFSKVQVNSLIKAVDVVVSLHRAEGFGLVMAEAMLNEIPCIATNWSANTEFMNEDVACMVDYKKVRIEKEIGPYAPGNYWADANINEASVYMRKLYEDVEYYHNKQIKAKAHIEETLSLKRITRLIEDRIEQIQNSH